MNSTAGGEVLEEVLAALRAGEVVGIPTDTVYGLAVDPHLPGATGRLFEAKRRPPDVALPVLVADAPTARELAGKLTAGAEALVARWWPGPLTLVVARNPAVFLDLGGDEATIGLRCPARSLVLELLRRAGPLAVTSANVHGEPALTTAGEVRSAFGSSLGAVLDGGVCNGEPSTVVSCLGPVVTLIREGAVPFTEVEAVAATGG